MGAYPSCPGSHCSLILVLSFSTDIGNPGFSGTAVIIFYNHSSNQGLTAVCLQSGGSKKSLILNLLSIVSAWSKKGRWLHGA